MTDQPSARRPATYEDLLRVPDHLVAEIVGGELYTSPRPAPRHSQAAGAVHSRLFRAFHEGDGGPGGWWILGEPELHLGDDVLVPDLGGWRRERMPSIPETAAITLAPDWVCEVISPSTAALDRVRKMPAYAAHEVQHAWLVDPIARTLEVFEWDHHRWILVATHEGDEKVKAVPFEAIEIDLLVLWGETPKT